MTAVASLQCRDHDKSRAYVLRETLGILATVKQTTEHRLACLLSNNKE